MKIKITKLAAVEGGCLAASNDEYVPGTEGVEGKSIPVDYWLEGVLLAPITVGENVRVLRESRCGVVCPGMFITSPVTQITKGGFTTQNSVYLFKDLTPEDNSVSLAV